MPLQAVARPPLRPSEKPPVLILLHGLASDENDLIGIATELDPRLYVISFRAPHETGYGGYAWFKIEFLPDGRRIVDNEQAVASRDTLLRAIQDLPVAASKLIVGGFSQGAMMAAGIVMEQPDLVDASWLMSGRYLPALDSGKPSAKPVPMLVQHGLYDEVLAVTEGRELAEVLESQGHAVIYKEYPMAHQISYESISDANTWLEQLI